MLCACQANSTKNTVQEQDGLSEHKINIQAYLPVIANIDIEDAAFSLIFLDSDTIPELVVLDRYLDQYSVYTIKEDSAICLIDSLTTVEMSYFEKENIISAVVHNDETTPHLHLNLIPIVRNKLSAKQLFTRASLLELQTDFHEKVGKKWGLERGKEGSQAKHIDTAEFKAKTIIERAEKRAEETEKQAKIKAEEYLNGIESSIEAERSKPIPKKKKAVEAEIESLRVENAAYKEHIAIKNRDTDYLFEQLQKAERQGKANDTAFKMVTDMMSAYPDEFDALLKKSRAKKSPPTSFNGNRNTSGKGGK